MNANFNFLRNLKKKSLAKDKKNASENSRKDDKNHVRSSGTQVNVTDF